MSVHTKSNLSIGYIVSWVVTLGSTIAIFMLPTNDTFTPEIRSFIAVTVLGLMLAAFEFFPIIVPSVLLMTGYYVIQCVPAEVAFGGWHSAVTWIVLGAFLLAMTFDEIGLLKRIAYWVILKAGGTFNRTAYGMLVAGIILTVITFGNSYVIMTALAYGVCKALELGKTTDSAIMMFAALIGAVTTRGVIYAPTNLSLMNAGAQTVLPDFELFWYNQFIDCFPTFLFAFLIMFIILKFRKNKEDVNSREFVQSEYNKLGKMSAKERKALIILGIIMVYLVTGPIHKLPMDYGFMIIPWFMFLPGVNVASISSVRQVDFSMVFFVVACLGIGYASGYLGIGSIVANFVTPILEPFGPLAVVFAIYFLGGLLNMLMTPLAFLAGFSGPVAQIAVALDLNPSAALYTLNFAADFILLPYEYVPYLIAYSFGVIPIVDFIKFNVIKLIAFLIFFMAIILPYWYLLGVM